jgi:hypothetical protein
MVCARPLARVPNFVAEPGRHRPRGVSQLGKLPFPNTTSHLHDRAFGNRLRAEITQCRKSGAGRSVRQGKLAGRCMTELDHCSSNSYIPASTACAIDVTEHNLRGETQLMSCRCTSWGDGLAGRLGDYAYDGARIRGYVAD